MASSRDTSNDRAARRAQQVKDRREQNARNRNQERQKRYVQNKRELTIIKVVAGLVAVGILAAIAVSVWNWGRDRELNRKPDGVIEYAYAGQQHRDGAIDYPLESDYHGEVPPAGGTHNNAWYQCGVYDGPIRWESAVHDLEHGGVWVAYRPDLRADQIEKIRGLGADDVLIAPEPLLRSPIVLTAWGNQLSLDSYDLGTVKRFIRYYKNNPAEDAPEVPANCASGATDLRAVDPATPADGSITVEPTATPPTAAAPQVVETPAVASPGAATPAASPAAATPVASPAASPAATT